MGFGAGLGPPGDATITHEIWRNARPGKEDAMSLIRWNPLRDMEVIFDRFDRQQSQESMTVADWTPTVDVSETDNEYLIKVELPEVRRENVKVTVRDGVLTLQGERSLDREEKNRKFHRVERAYGSFARSFTLPENVDADNVKAQHKDGMLYLHLGKTEEAKPKSIEVKVA